MNTIEKEFFVGEVREYILDVPTYRSPDIKTSKEQTFAVKEANISFGAVQITFGNANGQSVGASLSQPQQNPGYNFFFISVERVTAKVKLERLS